MQCDLPAAGLVPTEVSIRPWEKIYVAETGHGPVLGHDGPVKPENLYLIFCQINLVYHLARPSVWMTSTKVASSLLSLAAGEMSSQLKG